MADVPSLGPRRTARAGKNDGRRNLVVCCDGTGNEIGRNLSNVLKLYRLLEKDERQRVCYDPGVGTIGKPSTWRRLRQKAFGVFGLATGYGLDDNVLEAYRYLCETWREGDDIWLFGFSRGAYSVRILAGFIHVMGLLRPDQLNLVDYAWRAYKESSEDDSAARGEGEEPHSGLKAAWHFSRIAGARRVTIRFLGLWDTVASVIVPKKYGLLPSLQTLRYTRTNPSVEIVRHAIAIDERRRMFRLNRWIEPQDFVANPFVADSRRPQDIRQMWFAGVHADIGGGYPEEDSALSKFPLVWMVEEARDAGLRVDTAMFNHLARGKPRKGSAHSYVPPDAGGPLHVSLKGAWRVLEWLPPKSVRWREWKSRPSFLGWYLPRGEPRPIPSGAQIHSSVRDRQNWLPDYQPPNLPIAAQAEGEGETTSAAG